MTFHSMANTRYTELSSHQHMRKFTQMETSIYFDSECIQSHGQISSIESSFSLLFFKWKNNLFRSIKTKGSRIATKTHAVSVFATRHNTFAHFIIAIKCSARSSSLPLIALLQMHNLYLSFPELLLLLLLLGICIWIDARTHATSVYLWLNAVRDKNDDYTYTSRDGKSNCRTEPIRERTFVKDD